MNAMTEITIFYDLRCGLCCQVKAWMLRQRAYLKLNFLPFDSPMALAVLPELPDLDPAGQIVVHANTGEVYQGAEAWITCLWALRNWRGWAKRFSRPEWHPLAHHLCRLISGNRLKLSHWLHLTPDRAAQMEAPVTDSTGKCKDGACRM